MVSIWAINQDKLAHLMEREWDQNNIQVMQAHFKTNGLD